MEISFPLEFVVRETLVSQQAKRVASREEWKCRVRGASKSAIPDPHFVSDERMSVTLFYLPDEPMQGDIDNIIKPILDALSKHIYLEDAQVERVVAQKFEPGNVFSFDRPTDMFRMALIGAKPILYVRISNDPTEELR